MLPRAGYPVKGAAKQETENRPLPCIQKKRQNRRQRTVPFPREVPCLLTITNPALKTRGRVLNQRND